MFQAPILQLFLLTSPPSIPKGLVGLAKASRSLSVYTGADHSLHTLRD